MHVTNARKEALSRGEGGEDEETLDQETVQDQFILVRPRAYIQFPDLATPKNGFHYEICVLNTITAQATQFQTINQSSTDSKSQKVRNSQFLNPTRTMHRLSIPESQKFTVLESHKNLNSPLRTPSQAYMP
ncbi:hypothetical protein Fmac_014771 [Flemingia macrophylla]|uniref:Uncharacterized protein n=1 Tax=Flemingia macrophylla TaxID=520843 RepID=A0ABD1MDG9_9FABA